MRVQAASQAREGESGLSESQQSPISRQPTQKIGRESDYILQAASHHLYLPRRSPTLRLHPNYAGPRCPAAFGEALLANK